MKNKVKKHKWWHFFWGTTTSIGTVGNDIRLLHKKKCNRCDVVLKQFYKGLFNNTSLTGECGCDVCRINKGAIQ